MQKIPAAELAALAFSPAYRGYMLLVLTITYVFNGVDRSIMWVMLEPMKAELGLTDTQLGWLSGFAFGAVYGLVGIPIGLLADRTSRKRIVAAAIGIWSAMTIACGLAMNFWQLFFARIAVGAAESGAPPASLSLIADLYPRDKRASAIGIYMCATSVALVLTFGAGGWIAEHYGWRAGFWFAGIPGLILAALIWLTFREPPRGMSDPGMSNPAPPATADAVTLRQTLRVLRSRPSGPWMLLAFTLSALTGVGLSTFMSSFLIRSHQVSLAQAGLMIALAYTASALGIPLIGRLTDRLARRDARWNAWLPAVLCILCTPITLLLVTSPSVWVVGLLLCALNTCMSAQAVPVYATLQNLVEPRMRSTTLSIAYVLTNLVAVGFGAVIVGALSDALAPRFATAALSYALGLASLFFIIGLGSYLLAVRTIRRDLSAVGSRLPAS